MTRPNGTRNTGRARRRLLLTALAVAGAGLVWLVAAPAQWGGATTYVTTSGDSMEPHVGDGDVVVLRPADRYAVGDVVGYASTELGTVVLHRVVDVDGDRYVTRGDNNSWLDPDTPTGEQLLGREVLRVPQGGVWLGRLTAPPALAAYGFVLVMTTGAAQGTRRRRRRRTMSQHAESRRGRSSATALPPQLRTAATVTAAGGVAALGLAAFGWAGPLHRQASSESTTDHRMAFSYSATVPLTPAYDGTTVRSPDPVFRRLTDTVDVRFSYTGEPGTVEVGAEVSSANGWRSSIPLAEPTRFPADEYEDVVTLDLADLDARARAAAEVTGLPADQLTVRVVPSVTTSEGATFEPSLDLRLTPLLLALAGDPGTLAAEASTVVEQPAAEPRGLDLLGLTLTAGLARTLATALGAATALAAAVLLVVARWTAPATEAAAIRRRYSALLVPVRPMPAPPGRPVVDVTDFATLAKLAERYGLLVLHWTRSGIDTFVVQDEGTTYRYRAGLADRAEALEVEAVEPARPHRS